MGSAFAAKVSGASFGQYRSLAASVDMRRLPVPFLPRRHTEAQHDQWFVAALRSVGPSQAAVMTR